MFVFGGMYLVLILFVVVMVGNVIGFLVNWMFGCYLVWFVDCCWFLVLFVNFDCVVGWYVCWGWWSLLGSWFFVVGDLLMLVVGVLCELFWWFIFVVILVKSGCYVVLIFLM